MYKKIINFNKKVSQSILNDIMNNNEINFQKYGLDKFKNEILHIQNEYKKKTDTLTQSMPRYWFFWKLVSNKYQNYDIKLVKKNIRNISSVSRCNNNIQRTMFTKYLGFNPSILTLLLYYSEIKNLLSNTKYKLFDNIVKKAKFWPSTELEKDRINTCLNKNKVDIISTLCPDYDYNVIGKDLFSYTFDKLNETEGLGAKRILVNISNIRDFFITHNKKFNYDIFYGDFEGFSIENCKRLKISQLEFISKLKKSTEKIASQNIFNQVGLFVSTFTTKEKWLEKKNINMTYITSLSDNNPKFKKEIYDIARSRRSLYRSWYPDLGDNKHYKLVIDQGAEYASMGDIIFKNYENPLIIGADHPRMKIFYYLNHSLPVIYLNKGY